MYNLETKSNNRASYLSVTDMPQGLMLTFGIPCVVCLLYAIKVGYYRFVSESGLVLNYRLISLYTCNYQTRLCAFECTIPMELFICNSTCLRKLRFS